MKDAVVIKGNKAGMTVYLEKDTGRTGSDAGGGVPRRSDYYGKL